MSDLILDVLADLDQEIEHLKNNLAFGRSVNYERDVGVIRGVDLAREKIKERERKQYEPDED